MIIKFEENCVFLNELPMPPSVNDYVNRRYPTKNKKKFLKEWNDALLKVGKRKQFEVWNFLFKDTKKRALFVDRRAIATIRIEYIWLTNLLTKDKKRMKIIDSSNRIKLIEDCLAKFIGVDDCYFKEFSWDTYHYKEENFCARIYRPNLFDKGN